jgi:hypothetical protein
LTTNTSARTEVEFADYNNFHLDNYVGQSTHPCPYGAFLST